MTFDVLMLLTGVFPPCSAIELTKPWAAIAKLMNNTSLPFSSLIFSPYPYAVIIGVIGVTVISRKVSENLPKNQMRVQYLAVGLTKRNVEDARDLIGLSDASDAQKSWLELHVLSEVTNQISIGVLSRDKALTLLMAVRTIPLFTSLLTALAAQVDSIRPGALFGVNILMLAASYAIEASRTNRDYDTWAYARDTCNRLYAALGRYLTLDSAMANFQEFSREVDAIGQAYDTAMNSMIAMGLEAALMEENKEKKEGAAKG